MANSLLLLACMAPATLLRAQAGDTLKLTYRSDVLFRIEEDWNGLRSNGASYDDRTRMRVRARFGVEAARGPMRAGLRLRSGTSFKQQDPNITLGGGDAEQGPLPLTIDRAYIQFNKGRFAAWGGKDVFPFYRLDELFWSDHVCPEGLFVSAYAGKKDHKSGGRLTANAGHFIIRASNKGIDDDANLNAGQLVYRRIAPKYTVDLVSGLFAFANIPLLPDHPDTTRYDHPIMQSQAKVLLNIGRGICLGVEQSLNLDPPNDLPTEELNDQGFGLAAHLSYGRTKAGGDYLIGYSWCRLQKFSAIDYLAQNDWARWDHSATGSPDGSLTNMQGHRITLAWMPLDGLKLALIGYFVERIVDEGTHTERGDRVRFDVVYSF